MSILNQNPIDIVIFLTSLSLIPSIVILSTSFTRIIIVLSFLRTGLGLQQSPPNMVLMTFALLLTGFTMEPIFTNVYQNAFIPYQQQHLSSKQAILKAAKPIKVFMIKETKPETLNTIYHLKHLPIPNKAQQINLKELIPAFFISELQTAFEIGLMLLLPFLLIDLLVSSVLMALGMMMVPPMSIALPIKILVFTLIHGWTLVTSAIVQSF